MKRRKTKRPKYHAVRANKYGCPLRQNVTPASGGPTQFVKSLKQSQFHSLPRQAQVMGKETGTQRCAQEQRKDSWREDEETKDEKTQIPRGACK